MKKRTLIVVVIGLLATVLILFRVFNMSNEIDSVLDNYDSFNQYSNEYTHDDFLMNIYIGVSNNNQELIYNFNLLEKEEYTITVYCGDTMDESYVNVIDSIRAESKGDNVSSFKLEECNYHFLYFTYSYKNTEEIVFMFKIDLDEIE
jgi:hypothetical protein